MERCTLLNPGCAFIPSPQWVCGLVCFAWTQGSRTAAIGRYGHAYNQQEYVSHSIALPLTAGALIRSLDPPALTLRNDGHLFIQDVAVLAKLNEVRPRAKPNDISRSKTNPISL